MESDDESNNSSPEGSEAEDSSYEETVASITVENQLENVRNMITVQKRRWEDIDEDQKKRLLGGTTTHLQPTSLHILAGEKFFGKTMNKNDLGEMKKLVKYLVKADKTTLLQVKEDSGFTPLHTAIDSGNKQVAKWICATYDEVDEVLRQSGTKQKWNCIHLAVDRAKDGNDSTARNLVAYASANTLISKDEDGNTPLHLAVAYNKCTEGQIELVKAILAKSDHLAKDSPHHDCNKKQESPYGYHLASVAAAQDTAAAEAATASKEVSSSKPPLAENSVIPDQHLKHLERSKAGPRQPVDGPKTNIAPLMISSFDIEHGVSSSKGKPDMFRRPRDNKTPLPGPGAVSKAAKNAAGAEEIREYLKKHYLRSRGHADALKILYGENPELEKAIDFDLSEYRSLTTDDIAKHVSILKFENVLRYVDIPKLSVSPGSGQDDTPKSNHSRRRIPVAKRDGDGRTEVTAVFDQLRSSGVKSILEIIVEDLEHPAHSDAAIEQAICGKHGELNMAVEILNWKKVDLSPDLILKAASGVMSLQLYWSGQNAVLRAWSEEEGLPKLMKLNRLVLHVQGGHLDPLNRLQDNIKVFLERLLRQIARARAQEIVKDLRSYVDEQANNSKKELQDGHRERLKETSQGLKEALQTGLADAIFHALNARIKSTQSHGSPQLEDKKTALSGAKDKIREFFSSEKRKQMNSNGSNVVALLEEFSEARLRPKTLAKEIAEKMAPAHSDFNFECTFPTGKQRMYENGAQSTNGGYLEEPQDHPWIDCMTEFRKLLYNAQTSFCKEPGHAEVLKKAIAETGGPITVALIDDGIEMSQISFDQEVQEQLNGKSFFQNRKDTSKILPWHSSGQGHGTIMAGQIHRIAPKANIFVLRLHDTYYGQTNKRNITMRSAAEAVREAIRRKVHIISMSWTITPSSNEDETERKERKELEQAIMDAAAAEILMFCSASDEGAKQNDTLPSKAMSGSIFKIGGADVNGNLYERVGDIVAVDYTLPGHLVASEVPPDVTRSKVQYSSGSSVATALAAGLAALILYCAQIRVARARDLDGDTPDAAMKDFQRLRQHGGMKEVFNTLRSQNATGKNLDVWKTFGKKVEESNNIREVRGPNRPIDLVAGVAKSLCRQF